MSSPALFGILQLDRGEPYGFAQLPGLAQAWLQDAGGFAALGLVVYLLYAYRAPTHESQSERLRLPLSFGMVVLAALSLLCYAVVFLTIGAEYNDQPAVRVLGRAVPLYAPTPPPPPPGTDLRPVPPEFQTEVRPLVLMAAGAFALAGILIPFVRDAFKLRVRRVNALSRIAFKEAVRSRLLWVVAGLAAFPFLFPTTWFQNAPADELRSTVTVVTLCLMILVLVTAGLLSSFSLPNDIKNQTIHTVVTKPVERFEIILGRFFGYVALLTLMLAGLTAVSLALIEVSGVSPQAAEQSFTARVPIRGALDFKSRRENFEGTNVGREFEYRKYIAGHPQSPQRAIWNFPAVPSRLASAADDRVPVEFTFDIFRLTKGEENRGVDVSFRFVTHHCPQRRPEIAREGEGGDWPWADPQARERYAAAVKAAFPPAGRDRPETARPGTDAWARVNKLAEEFGYFELRGKEVYNNRVVTLDVPAGLFRNALKDAPPAGAPPFQVFVKCESPGQMLGMAGPDLYLLEANRTFAQNYVKWAVGLWCRLCLVVGLAVVFSTYLPGVLSLLGAGLLYVTGYFGDFIRDVALNRNVGGGAFGAFKNIVNAEPATAPTADAGGTSILAVLDKLMAWGVRRFQNLIPDVEQFGWSHFVAEGFNVNAEYLVLNVLLMAGYLLPWFVLGYYLLRTREVAG